MKFDTNKIKSKSSEFGLCPDCNKSYTKNKWCKECNAKRFQQDFPNWTSGNEFIDRFIREAQLNSGCNDHVVEWIPYNKLGNIEDYNKEKKNSTVSYKATWLDGPIQQWSDNERRWIRFNDFKVIFRNLNSSEESLNKLKKNYNGGLIQLNGITQDPNTLGYMEVIVKNETKVGVFKTSDYNLNHYERVEKYKDFEIILCEKCNKQLPRFYYYCENCYNEATYEQGELMEYGLCSNCNEPNTNNKCINCEIKWFQQDFPNWTSRNQFIDKFIQETQLNTYDDKLEWIPYNRLKNIEYHNNEELNIVYKAIWLDGPIRRLSGRKRNWIRYKNSNVVLKNLNNSSNLDNEFLKKWKHHYKCYIDHYKRYIDHYKHHYTVNNIQRIYGFTQDPNTFNYMIIMEYAEGKKEPMVGFIKISDYDLNMNERIEKFKDYDFILCEKCNEILDNKIYCSNCYQNETNEEIRKHIRYGKCKVCFQINTGINWCKECSAKWFQQDFSNWTSGNKFIDEFIQETQLNAMKRSDVLEWIPYNRFENIEYLDRGGFSTIYKANWLDGIIQGCSYDERKWIRNNNFKVALKSLNNSSNLSGEFLNEVKHHFMCKVSPSLVHIYGFTQNPITSNYMIALFYADKGSLRKNLPMIVKDKWHIKLSKLEEIISGLVDIHNSNFVHCDFHDGNILMYGEHTSLATISDLGLTKPIEYFQSSSKETKIYGVLPFVAPEVLKYKPYSKASDIYSFSMIMWEFTSGIPPFNDREHGLHLGLSICKGERPEIIKNTPQCYVNLMKKCWNDDPLKRPIALEIQNIIKRWNYINDKIREKDSIDIIEYRKMDKILEQEQINTKISNTESHKQAYHVSRLLDLTKKLNEIFDEINNVGLHKSGIQNIDALDDLINEDKVKED